jgi:hypothetical protein
MSRENPAPGRDYSVFGLRVRSSIPLPELFPAEGTDKPDVTITSGPIPDAAQAKPGLTPTDGGLLLFLPTIGRFRIQSGRLITVDPDPGVPERNLRLFLLGSAFGALLHQRGLLPLHANAVEIAGSAVAFMGPSGAGKSTLAAWFHDHGCRVIADDVCVVGIDRENHPYAAPGLPRLRLWREALELMGRGTEGYDRSYVGPLENADKFDVPISTSAAATDQRRLAAVYLLDRADSFSVQRLHGVEAAEAIFANTYRGSFVSRAGSQRQHWQTVVRLVEATPVYRVCRRWDLAALDDQSQAIFQHVASLDGPQSR